MPVAALAQAQALREAGEWEAHAEVARELLRRQRISARLRETATIKRRLARLKAQLEREAGR